MLVRVEQERLESLKYDRATIYIKCVEDNEDTKLENDFEVRDGIKIHRFDSLEFGRRSRRDGRRREEESAGRVNYSTGDGETTDFC